MWGCKLANDDIINFGVKADWATHRIAHELGGIYNLPHCQLVGIIFLAWLKLIPGRNQIGYHY